MSYASFSPTKKESVPIGSVWEYLPSHPRDGRFQVKAFCPRRLDIVGAVDLYEVAEVNRGEVRKYTEDDILAMAKMTQIQPGSKWLDPGKRACKIDRPEYGTGGWRIGDEHVWLYSCSARSLGSGRAVESEILRYWEPAPNSGSKVQTCPLCGGAGVQLFTSFECAVSICKNARRVG